jgi:eukaryotic-like serine/threonine-protein kinase
MMPTLRYRVVGTPEYMAPEQIRTQAIDGRADQFSWAVMAYELLTGELPFRGDIPIDILQSILETQPPTPSSVAQLPAEIDEILMRALAKKAEDRWPSMRVIAIRLAQVQVAAAHALGPESRRVSTESVTVDATVAARALADASASSPGVALPMWAKETARLEPVAMPRATEKPSPTRDLKPWIRAGLAVAAVLSIIACVLLVLILRAPATEESPVAVESVPPTEPTVTAVTVDSLPIPTCKDAAVGVYREGLGLIREGNWEGAHGRFEAASKSDPDCPEAWFRLVMTGRSHYSATELRTVFQRAVALRSRLTERDRALLDAYEPLVARDPPDRVEFSRRLVSLAERHPTDVEVLTKMVFHATTAPLSLRMAAARRSTELDPTFSDAWQSLGRTLAESNEPEGALAAYTKCIDLAIGSTDCLADRLRETSLQGRCSAGEDDARKWVARSPDTATGHLWHAEVLVAQEKPRESVETVLRRRWSKLPSGSPDVLLERAKLAAVYGSFDVALEELQRHEEAVATDLNVEPHARGRLFEVEILLETGRKREASKVIRRFFDSSSAWSGNIATDVQQLPVYYFPQHAARLARKGSEAPVVPVDWFARASSDGTLNALATWVFSDAYFALSRADAETALARAPVPIDPALGVTYQLPKSARSATTLIELGRVLERGGRGRDAYGLASGACGAFGDTLASTQALVAKGRTLEDSDVPGACAAYRSLLRRWEGSKSVSAEIASERVKALACN